MAETVKKAKTITPKAAKPAAEKKAPAEKKATTAKAKKATVETSKIFLMPPSHDQIASLAHKYWSERGHEHGSHEDDWYRAEQELRGKAS